LVKKFPGDEKTTYTTIGAFFFLRFICPAIISPELYGLTFSTELNNQQRRYLLLITKVLQKLANFSEFGNTEEYMKKLNDFIYTNRDQMSDFLEEISTIEADQPSEHEGGGHGAPHTTDVPKNVRENSLIYLHVYIKDNLAKILTHLESEVPPNDYYTLKDQIIDVLDSIKPATHSAGTRTSDRDSSEKGSSSIVSH